MHSQERKGKIATKGKESKITSAEVTYKFQVFQIIKHSRPRMLSTKYKAGTYRKPTNTD